MYVLPPITLMGMKCGIGATVVSVSEHSYQYRSKMNWTNPEFDQHELKPWAQVEKCKYSIDKTNTDI